MQLSDYNTPPPYRYRKKGRLWLFTGIIALVLGIIYYFADPETSRFMPRCLFHTLTGWDCPGCGAQRMVHALIHGDFKSAWSANAFIICMLPLICFGIWGDMRPGRVRRIFYHTLTIQAIIIAICAWGVLRNIL